ncbi:MAG: HEAT repeat domain-containing protein, partial [Longimicrobiales bacterium]
EQHPEAATREDGEALLIRIDGDLARTGDADARASVTGRAAQPCDDEEQELKSMALSALMNMDEERAVPILRGVLESQNACSEELRAEAVFILSQKMSDDVVPLMVELAIDNPDPSSEVREAAVFALSQTQDPRAEDALERILTTSDDHEVQEQALFALSQRSSERSRRVLRDYAASDAVDPDLRETAIFWVGQGEGAESFDFLNQIFQSTQDEDVKESVVFAMTQTNDPRLPAWLLTVIRDSAEDMEARKNALFWYGQTGDEVDVAELLGLYQEVGDTELKEAVLFGLSQRISDDAALEALIEIARTEEDAEVVENALFWLGQSDDPRAVEFLLEIIRR